MLKRNIFFIMLPIIMFLSHKAIAFDNEITHPDITEKAIYSSNMVNYIITDLGFVSGLRTALPSNSEKTVLYWLRKGATDEDKPICRASHHFHNPLLPWLQSQMSDTPWMDYACDVPRYSNITWATGYTSPPPLGAKTTVAVSPFYSRLSWDSARDYFYKALTFSANADRENYFAKTFEAIGHVLHLLEDMAVPAHTRNDFESHLFPNSASFLGGFIDRYQPFEQYVQNNPNLVVSAQTVTPSFADTRLTDFWDTDQYNGSNPSTFTNIGLAEFSNSNYFSDFTIPNNGVTPQHTFPYPHLGSTNISGPNYQICTYQFFGIASVNYVSRMNGGPCPPTAVAADHFAVVSLMNMPGTSSDINSISHVWLNDDVYEQYAKELLPRAVGYSAGLLNYFFRGTLDVSWPNTGVYSIADGSQTPYTDTNGNHHQQFTKIRAAILNITPNEAIGAGTLTAVARYKIIPNYTPDLSHYPPDGTTMTAVPYSYSVSQSEPVTGINAADYTDITFNFAPAPIPVGITDLTLQVVFKGAIGNEADNAIAVGMKDIMEPTHLTFWNLSDMFSLQYPGSDYELYTFAKLQNMAQPSTSLLNWLDETQDGSLNDELYLKPLTSTFTISFWNNQAMIPAVTVDIPAGNHIRPIVLVNQSANNYFELKWVDPARSDSVTLLFTGVMNQADQNGAYSTPTPIDTFRQGYAADGQILVPILQHYYTGVVGCKPGTGSPYCPYSDEDADPASLTPIPFTSVFN